MSEDRKSRDSGGGGLRQGLGLLSALKDTVEETIQEAKERGDLDPERAKGYVKDAVRRAQEVAGDARTRLEEMRRRDVPSVREAVDDLKGRVEKLEQALRCSVGSEASEEASSGDVRSDGTSAGEA
jgi:polyhydroxyalkanoate synthesis regulator phasin